MVKFNKLMRNEMRKLNSGEKLTEHGIIFERLTNGDGRFSVNIMVDGQRIHRTIGTEGDGTTRTQAEEFIEKIKRDAKEGRLSLPKGRKLALSFAEAAEKYLKKLEDENGKDLVMKRKRINLHLSPYFNVMPLNKIGSSDIEGYKKFRCDEKAAVATINRELAVLSHIFSKAIEWTWIDKKPAVINRYKEERNRIDYLTIEEIKLLLEAAKKDDNPQIYPFIMIALETSLRRMAVLAIKIEDIDLKRHVIYIPRTKGTSHQQPITPNLAKFLKQYLKNIDRNQIWLFPSLTSTPGHTIAIEKPFRRVVKAAKLDPDRIVRHTLRHTAITHLVQAGVDLPTVQRISGHKTLQMVMRYSHQNGQHIQAAMKRLEQRYKSH